MFNWDTSKVALGRTILAELGFKSASTTSVLHGGMTNIHVRKVGFKTGDVNISSTCLTQVQTPNLSTHKFAIASYTLLA